MDQGKLKIEIYKETSKDIERETKIGIEKKFSES